jgi:hypothetical protein
MSLSPDERWQNIVGGVSATGEVKPMSVEVLEGLADELHEIVGDVSGGPSELLGTARSLLVQSWFNYDLLAEACLKSLQAVEAAVRRHYPDKIKVPFRKLIDRAEQDGLLSKEAADILRAGVHIRNMLSHPEQQKTFTLGMAFPALRTSHLLIAELAIGDKMRP